MKTIGLIGFILSFLASLLATYVVLIIYPELLLVDGAEIGTMQHEQFYVLSSFLKDFSLLTFVIGFFASAMTITAGIRMQNSKLIIPICLSLFALFTGVYFGFGLYLR